jgi:hypothetical protein
MGLIPNINWLPSWWQLIPNRRRRRRPRRPTYRPTQAQLRAQALARAANDAAWKAHSAQVAAVKAHNEQTWATYCEQRGDVSWRRKLRDSVTPLGRRVVYTKPRLIAAGITLVMGYGIVAAIVTEVV